VHHGRLHARLMVTCKNQAEQDYDHGRYGVDGDARSNICGLREVIVVKVGIVSTRLDEATKRL
jgi:hypothetical protein